MKRIKLFPAVISAVLMISIATMTAAAALGFFGKATLFKGRIAPLGVVTEDTRIRFIKGEALGRVADLANEEIEFPALTDVKYDINAGVWLSGEESIPKATPTVSFKIASDVGRIENLRCRLDIEGEDQLASTIRVGIVLEYPSGEKKAAILNGFEDVAAVDVSVAPYSMNIGKIDSGEPVSVTAYAWVDKNALSQVGKYADDEFAVSLIIY